MLRHTFLTSVCALAFTVPAYAQNKAPSEGKTVFEQYRDQYRPEGARVGAFIIQPYGAAGVTYTDNLFAVGETSNVNVVQDPRGDQDAFVYNVVGGVNARTDWENHGVRAYAEVATEQIPEFDEESATTYEAGGSAYLDVGLFSQITVGGSYISDVEDRTARFTSTVSRERVAFDESEVYLEGRREAGIIKVKARAERNSLDFENGVINDGLSEAGNVDRQDDRDRDTYRFSSRVSAELSPSLDVFVGGDYLITEFDSEPSAMPMPGEERIDRDSKQWGVDAGFAMNFTNLLRGEAAFGYAQRDIEDPSIDNREIITTNIGLEWFVSPITTVTLNAKRDIRDAFFDNGQTTTRSQVNMVVQRRVAERIVAGVRGSYQNFDFRGDVIEDTGGGPMTRETDRRDQDYIVGANVTYALTRGVDVDFVYQRQERESSGLDQNRSFTDNRLTLTLGVAF